MTKHVRSFWWSLPGLARLSLLLIVGLGLLDLIFPLPDPAAQGERFTQVVVDQNQRLLRAFPDDRGVWRYPISSHQVASDYLKAVVGYEDRWFWYHPGVNPVAVLRALIQNLRCDCIVSGGSTITMQVARRIDPHKRSYTGKIRQILRALQLEWHFSKDEILSLYLNYVPMGGVIEGTEAASQLYLGKPASQLSLAESALLAVLPQAPSRLRPDRYPDRAQAARNKVLQRLYRFGDITRDELEAALLEPVFVSSPETPMFAPLLTRQLTTEDPDSSVIHTTLDLDLQRELQHLMADEIRRFPAHHSAAILIVDNHSHEVKAYLGSADFSDNDRFGHVDMIRATRSPGSTLKPFIYGLAMEQGLIHSASLLRDVPRHHRSYQPENFSQSFNGPVDTATALRRSLNLPAVQVLEALGPARFTAALTNAGTPYVLPAGATSNLSLALGGGGFSLWKLATLYSSLSNGGHVVPLKVRQDVASKDARWLMSPEAAWVVRHLLRQRNPDSYTNPALRSRGAPMAWKTGTSYGFRDAWAVGVTPDLTIAVWFGRPDGTAAPGQYGGLTALPLLFRLQERLDPSPLWPAAPEQVREAVICWPGGRLAAETPAGQCHISHQAWLIREQVPPTLRNETADGLAPPVLTIQLDQNGKMISPGCQVERQQMLTRQIAVWPGNLYPWLPGRLHLREQLPELNPDCPPPELPVQPLTITGIEHGQQIIPSDPAATDIVVKVATLGGYGDKDWFLNGRTITTEPESNSVEVHLDTPGDQELIVLDEQGAIDRITFRFGLRSPAETQTAPVSAAR